MWQMLDDYYFMNKILKYKGITDTDFSTAAVEARNQLDNCLQCVREK